MFFRSKRQSAVPAATATLVYSQLGISTESGACYGMAGQVVTGEFERRELAQ